MTAQIVTETLPPVTAGDRCWACVGAVPTPATTASLPPANDRAAFSRYLWLDEYERHATHAVYSGVTNRALRLGDAECERQAARWLAAHPAQARPELSAAVYAFGEAA